jgi:hypothetical protein
MKSADRDTDLFSRGLKNRAGLDSGIIVLDQKASLALGGLSRFFKPRLNVNTRPGDR